MTLAVVKVQPSWRWPSWREAAAGDGRDDCVNWNGVQQNM